MDSNNHYLGIGSVKAVISPNSVERSESPAVVFSSQHKHKPPATANELLSPLNYRQIIGMRVDATNYTDATNRIIAGARDRIGKYVCAANVHMVMESHDSKSFAQIVNRAYLVTPDGMPMVVGLRLLGIADATRVCGPDLTLTVCAAAAHQNIPIALYGGTEESLKDFTNFLLKEYPQLPVVCAISPPFRPLSPTEDLAYTQQIVDSGAQIVFVGIGCPRQEIWMAQHQQQIPAVMIGVGAAFDFHSGRIKQAPVWMRRLCLEWLFRLMMEPKRLWKRYFKHNPRFIWLFLLQSIGHLFRSNKY